VASVTVAERTAEAGIEMGKRGKFADTHENAAKLQPHELAQQTAHARWRLGFAGNSTLRNLARKRLAMLTKAQRNAGRKA
jgi:hypothetical protein